MYISNDRGKQWRFGALRGRGFRITGLLLDPADPSAFYIARRGAGVHRSVDGGRSFKKRNRGLPHRYIHALALDPLNPATLYAGTRRQGVYKSVDQGRNWRPANTGIEQVTVETLLVDPDTSSNLYLGAYQGGIFRSRDGGESWKRLGNSDELGVIYALTLSGTTLAVGTGRGIYSFGLE